MHTKDIMQNTLEIISDVIESDVIESDVAFHTKLIPNLLYQKTCRTNTARQDF